MTVTTYVFDLDGTLVDTKAAVVAAYTEAGAVFPHDAWGLSWREWLVRDYGEQVAKEIHATKDRLYPDALLLHARRLPLLDVAVRLDARVITGASAAAVIAIKRRFSCPTLRVAMTGATREMKSRFLETVAMGSLSLIEMAGLPAKFDGIYVDDDPVTRTLIEEKTTWQTLSPEQFLQSFSGSERPVKETVRSAGHTENVSSETGSSRGS